MIEGVVGSCKVILKPFAGFLFRSLPKDLQPFFIGVLPKNLQPLSQVQDTSLSPRVGFSGDLY